MKISVEGEVIQQRIYFLRGHKVMFSHDLAELYQVKTKVLLQAVKRNKMRFPEDFMFRLSWEEVKHLLLFSTGQEIPLRSRIVTLKQGQHIKYLPYAFTEQGVAMLSSVLRSPRAVRVNIEIMRAFVRLRQILATHKDLASKLIELEKKYDAQFKIVFDAIRQLMRQEERPKPRIGFHPIREE